MRTPTGVGRSEDNPGSREARAGGIAQPPPGERLRVCRQPMRVHARRGEDVAHVLAPGDQRIGDQLAVAAPRHGFRAQDRGRPAPRQGSQARRPAPAEIGLVMVADARLLERRRQCVAGELRVTARRRIATHVHDLGDSMGRQQSQKLFELPRRVANGVDHSEKQNATAGLVATRITSELVEVSGEEDCMTEKEQFLIQLEKELPTTMRVLKAYPAARADLKPHAKCKSARELAWMFVTEQKASEQALDGGIEFGKMPKAPATLPEVVAVYEQSSKAFVDRIRKTPDAELNKTVKFFVAPKQMGDVRKMDLLWFMLMDQVHHRGQFSVYLRMADGKVPSIYGPSADEPWM
jgi:uncharacterized damage-inducible protein DinB